MEKGILLLKKTSWIDLVTNGQDFPYLYLSNNSFTHYSRTIYKKYLVTLSTNKVLEYLDRSFKIRIQDITLGHFIFSLHSHHYDKISFISTIIPSETTRGT